MTRLTPEEYHVPVMLTECIEYLRLADGGVIVDATLGGGGHTRSMLDFDGATSPIHVVAFDADEVAINRARETYLEDYKDRLTIVHSNFESMADHLKSLPPVHSVLFDLGVSSFQFDHHERGFSYRHESPLDMRFTPSGETAGDILNTSSLEELTRVFREYGEDPSAYKLANAIVRRRGLAPYQTTIDLRDTIVQHIPPLHQNKTLARIFQALRIAVNRELDVLKTALTSVLPFVEVGGRIVVMSYHSLEDRIVKETFKEAGGQGAEDGLKLKLLTKKPVVASAAEQAQNPRSRSARLRAAEIVSSPTVSS